MSDWFEAHVASVSPAAEGLVHVILDVPKGVAGSHTSPGQYVKLAIEGVGEGFFAIASRPHPGGHRFDLLLKLGTPLTDAIAHLAPGSALRSSAALGKGFPIDRAVGRDLVLVATGSGISPVRSVIEAVMQRRADFGIVSLYFGVRTPGSFAYRQSFDEWRAAKVEVYPVVSRPQDTGWTGLTGYVQSHLGGVHVPTALAFLCGQKAMVTAVREALAKLGMPADSMYLNF
jgi:NAD(P)H-flavin reductase